MKIPPPTPAAVKFLEELTPDETNVTVRKMFGQPTAFVNGNMFLGTFGDNVFVRLSDEDRARAEKVPGIRPFEPMEGRPMRGYVVLPRSVLADRTESRRWVALSLAHAASLPPKKSKRGPR